jgi:AmmeMemoRadiSam system protein B
MAKESVRQSVIAGTWYPGSPPQLRRMIDGFLDGALPADLPGELVALIVPHAGYIYSGPVAAQAYALVRGRQYDLVAVVSPVHRMGIGHLAATNADFYETPLGRVPVARGALDTLAEECSVQYVEQDSEHALEIQLPFLQQVLLDGFQLLPVMMGSQTWETCTALAKGLTEALKDRKALLIASSDLSHFYPQPKAQRLDQVMLDRVNAFDPEGLSRDLASGSTEACGGGPVVAVLMAAKALGAAGARVLKYATSGDVTGDYSSVVGYMAAAVYGR